MFFLFLDEFGAAIAGSFIDNALHYLMLVFLMIRGFFYDVSKEEIFQPQNHLKFDLFISKNPARKHIYGVGNDVL